jgi:hypothetical protein
MSEESTMDKRRVMTMKEMVVTRDAKFKGREEEKTRERKEGGEAEWLEAQHLTSAESLPTGH